MEYSYWTNGSESAASFPRELETALGDLQGEINEMIENGYDEQEYDIDRIKIVHDYNGVNKTWDILVPSNWEIAGDVYDDE
jgi:hypothetical protein